MGKFNNILLYIKKIPNHSYNQPNKLSLITTFSQVVELLITTRCNLCFDSSCEQLLAITNLPAGINYVERKLCDLIMIIGGDGSLLHAIRDNISYQIPFLGINQGRLGFLADLNNANLSQYLPEILAGNFIQEPRSLLQATIQRATDQTIFNYLAVNDIVLYSERLPKLFEFQILIDQKFMLQQHADGLVIATPTGSTAYALSAGGPILYPNVPNFVLVPLYPHTLSSRPIVINQDSSIELKILPNLDSINTLDYGLNFDGQVNFKLQPNDQIIINKYPTSATLLHPQDHDYFKVLREKLNWHK